VYLTGVKDGIDQSDLQEYFSEFGTVDSVEIVVDRETRKSRGFAFVSFSDYDPVDKIVSKFYLVSNLGLLLITKIFYRAAWNADVV